MTSKHASSWIETITRSLISGAARRAPAGLGPRLEEEWLADLGARRGLARLRFALGCCWATHVIALEQARPMAASAGGGSWSLSAFADASSLSRRYPLFLLVVALHAALLYGLIVGIHETYSKPDDGGMRIDPMPAPAPPPAPPTTTDKPHLVSTVIVNPPPPVIRELEPPDGKIVPGPPGESAPPRTFEGQPPTHVVTRQAGGAGSGFPAPDDYYPSLSIYLRESGVATVKVCVNGNGRLTATPSIEATSGSARLDGAALRLARDGSGHYRPTIEDGNAVADCYPLRIRFQLKN